MPIELQHDLSSLNLSELYTVYLAIALADHKWRVRTMYGDVAPLAGHHEFRPLAIEQFDARIDSARTMVGGESLLRQRLARQASAYRVDVDTELSRMRQAA